MRTPPNERVASDIAESPSRSREGPGVGKTASRRNSSTSAPSSKWEGSERRCILTGDHGGRDDLFRLAISPDGDVLPDPAAKAPGRGAWIGVSRARLEEALGKGHLKGALARAFKGVPLSIPEDLPQRIEDALMRNLRDRLGLELRAGRLVLGSDRIAEQARQGRIALLLHASDASEDGRKKLDQAWRVGRDAEGSGERGRVLPLDRVALSVALGRDNVVHLGLADAPSAHRVEAVLQRLENYLHGESRADEGRAAQSDPALDDELNA